MAATNSLKIPLYTIRNVELFATGTHRNVDWTENDIDEIVSNFDQFQKPLQDNKTLFNVPAVIGHEEDQTLLTNSGSPRLGTLCNLNKVKGEDGVVKLKGDFCNVPEFLALLINNGMYDRVSGEIYKNPPTGAEQARGKMLRRISFLGADIPEVKNLKDLPIPELQSSLGKMNDKYEYKEISKNRIETILNTTSVRFNKKENTYCVFSEVKIKDSNMAKKAAVKKAPAKFAEAPPRETPLDDTRSKLAERGLDSSMLSGMSDENLTKLYRWIDNQKFNYADDTGGEATENFAKETGPEEPEGDDSDTVHVDINSHKQEDESGEGDKEVADMIEKFMCDMNSKYGELFIKHMAEYTKKMAESSTGSTESSPESKEEVKDDPDKKDDLEQEMEMRSPTQPGAKVAMNEADKFAERVLNKVQPVLDSKLQELTKKTKQLEDYQSALERAAQVKEIDSFCELMINRGLMTPADCDTSVTHSKKSRLLRAVGSKQVHKFTENGKEVTKSELELQMEEIQRSPKIIKYSEVINKEGKTTTQEKDLQEEADLVEAEKFFEQHEESFLAVGTSKKEWIDTFKAADKENRLALIRS